MATVVLLHGGWSGGWVWDAVAECLRGRGHGVTAPTLTGFGERRHLLSPDVTFGTLVNDVLNVIRYGELGGAALVAHSLHGPLAQAVAARVSPGLARVILLDAFVIGDGQRTVDAFDPAFTAGLQQWVDAAGEGWFVPRMEPEPGGVDAREARGRHTAMPWRPYLEPVTLGTIAAPRSYVLCTEKSESPADAAVLASAQRARESGWEVSEFAAGCVLMWPVPMWTAPEALSGRLEELMGG